MGPPPEKEQMAKHDDDGPKTLSVPEAGWIYYRLSKNSSYKAARDGQIPTIRVGRLLRVPVAAMERKMESVA